MPATAAAAAVALKMVVAPAALAATRLAAAAARGVPEASVPAVPVVPAVARPRDPAAAAAAAVTTEAAAEVAVAPTRSTRAAAVADPDMLSRVRMPAGPGKVGTPVTATATDPSHSTGRQTKGRLYSAASFARDNAALPWKRQVVISR